MKIQRKNRQKVPGPGEHHRVTQLSESKGEKIRSWVLSFLKIRA